MHLISCILIIALLIYFGSHISTAGVFFPQPGPKDKFPEVAGVIGVIAGIVAVVCFIAMLVA